MSNQGPTNGDDHDPMSEMFRRMFGGNAPDPEEIQRAMNQFGGGMPFDPSMMDPQMIQNMMQQFQFMMHSSDEEGPVKWDLAKQTARQTVAGQDPSVGSFAAKEISDALRLADSWLDQATTLEPANVPVVSWSRAEWVESTMDNWREMTEPVVLSLSEALTRAVTEQLPGQLPEELQGAMGNMEPMMKNLGGSMFGLQLGHAIGELAQEVLSGTDTGFPVAGQRMAMLPVNIEEFGDGLDIEPDQVRIYLALREAARMRLYANSPWLARDLTAMVQQYAAGISIDVSAIEDAVQTLDPMDPESMNQMFSGSMFIPEPEGAQKAAIEQLETLLALVEGWVDVVVTEAAKPLESADAMREMINRRRASGGPAEHAFGSLVGLDLRPRRLNDAAELWSTIEESEGREYRDAIWESQLRLPTQEDLDDPQGYMKRRESAAEQSASLDEDLKKLLEGGYEDN
ncbi:zinc-dependent metalloprotease [Enteractinococcus fodinae]|uniref:Hydrolase n=1 Tax=Enteractinococcus fodinae TaxID=684663 RepID=A0ABU2AZX7_9MICC|nr:zinc-dependent metalloprotease [Enteractinococcus fodinae]MDR7346706.1 putative hydrolase [Enteractinococcus fodinae]